MAFLKVEGDWAVPEGYRLATVEDVRSDVGAVGQVLPGWEIARLAGVADVSGRLYGVETTMDHRSRGLGHSLCVTNAFLRVEGDWAVPEGYRLATVEDVRLHVRTVGKVLPGWEIARLEGGAAVFGRLYGVETTMDHRSSELGHSLCVESEGGQRHTRPGQLVQQFAGRSGSSPAAPPRAPTLSRTTLPPQHRIHMPLARPAAAPATPAAPTAAAADLDTTCVICMTSPRQVGFLHGATVHNCACRDCAKLIPASSPCPICRQRIERVLEVY